jgi:hypothetical protein
VFRDKKTGEKAELSAEKLKKTARIARALKLPKKREIVSP